MPSNHTRQSLEALARDNPAELRRIIAGILGYVGEKEIYGYTLTGGLPLTKTAWIKDGKKLYQLPDWPGSLDACVELCEFAAAHGFRPQLKFTKRPDFIEWEMLEPPEEHAIAFILAAQEAGHADSK